MIDKRPSFKEYFIGMAKQASVRSSCIRANVGVVIVNKDSRIIATGYNGTPYKVESCLERGYCFRIANNIKSGTMYEKCRSIHAELNAILQAGIHETRGCDMYLYGHSFCCIQCKRAIVQAGIVNVYLQKDENSEIVCYTVDEFKKELDEEVL